MLTECFQRSVPSLILQRVNCALMTSDRLLDKKSDAEKNKRQPIPLNDIHYIQRECHRADDQARWLIVMISDNGRLGEAVGLVK